MVVQFFALTNIFKYGYFISSGLRDIDERPSVREKEKKEKKKEKTAIAICPFLLRKRAIKTSKLHRKALQMSRFL